ncbi:S-adenosylmethionine-dependent methyltransferase Rv2258c-like [Diadema setosum]|uniref:S-adenosylmethionine-dependent methyltransferase Rv2258c-like n=1 Tax=Diadema setosum TaxID=31175 RepID=UPI003B3A5C56
MATEFRTQETKESFGEYLSDMQVKGFTALGVAMGVATGLLEKMSHLDEPKSCEEISEIAHLKERYVRELLGILVCGRIVDYDAVSDTFFLPFHRRSFFIPGNIEHEIPIGIGHVTSLSYAVNDVRECFSPNDPRGLSNEHFSYMPEMSSLRFQHYLLDELKDFPGLHEQLESGIQVLDLACGPGSASILMAKHYPTSRFMGLDISPDVIVKAEEAAKGLPNVEFQCVSAEGLPSELSEKFDFLFIYNAIHDCFHPEKAVREAFRVLKPGAKAMIQEPYARTKLADNAQDPSMACVYTYSLYCCLPQANIPDDAAGLGAAWGKERCQEMLEGVGFKVVSTKPGSGKKTWCFHCTKPENEDHSAGATAH